VQVYPVPAGQCLFPTIPSPVAIVNGRTRWLAGFAVVTADPCAEVTGTFIPTRSAALSVTTVLGDRICWSRYVSSTFWAADLPEVGTPVRHGWTGLI